MIASLVPALPDRIAVGAGTAVLVRGVFATLREPTSLFLSLDGRRTPIRATMPTGERSRTRFWASVDLLPSYAGLVSLSLIAVHADQHEEWAWLGDIEVAHEVDLPPDANGLPIMPPDDRADWVGICMATFEPEPTLLRAQVRSLLAQTHRHWIAVICDDGSSTAAVEVIRAETAADTRFHVLPNARRVGAYRNFERALAAVPHWVRSIAYCDQDDVWHPSKLERMVTRLTSPTRLVVCDARIVDETGTVISDTWWTTRRHLPSDFTSIATANSVPGCASLWDSRLRDLVFPFQTTLGRLVHDGWTATAAALAGAIERIDDPLLDYVQHSGNTLGHGGSVDRQLGRLSWPGVYGALRSPEFRRVLAAEQVDFAVGVEVMARTLCLRADSAPIAVRRDVRAVCCPGGEVGRIAKHLARAVREAALGGLPGFELTVARGLVGAMVGRSRAARLVFGCGR